METISILETLEITILSGNGNDVNTGGDGADNVNCSKERTLLQTFSQGKTR